MKKICKNCQFWERVDNNHYGECSSKKFNDLSNFKYITDNELAYVGHYGNDVGFFVGESFGCIHFKKKEI